MIKAVLLDMDNTLLCNPDVQFAKQFLTHFDEYMRIKTGSDALPMAFRQAIKQMSSARDGEETNFDLTLRVLSDAAQISSETIKDAYKRFYEDVYPQLQPCIQPIDGAKQLLDELIALGLKIVIATNPIYPESAIRQRLSWANLPDIEDFVLVTTANNMHFSKPDIAYYAEIIARIGVEPDEALMVGDSIRSDIRPASTLGLRTYHVHDYDLGDLIRNLDRILNQDVDFRLKPEMVEPQLLGNIGAIFGMIQNVERDFWHQQPDANEWSIVQILCHLLSTEVEHQRPRLEKILSEDNPFIAARKPPGLNIDVCCDDAYIIVRRFRDARQETIKLIRELNEPDWYRPARHSIFGLTNLLEMACFAAQHDRLHINQLCETIGRCRQEK